MTQAASPVRLPGGYHEAVLLALPVVLSMLAQTLAAAVESAMLGRYGTVEQGAAGLAGALLWPILVACNCSGIGVQICVAQAMGAQRRPECGAITWQGLYVTGLAWVPMLLVGVYAFSFVQLLAPSPELVVPTALYLRIELLGGLPALLNVTLVGFFRGLGDTRTPLVVTLIVQLLNMLLAFGLIFGLVGLPRLGLVGAALATVGARLVGTAIYLWLFIRCGQREGFLAQPCLPFDRASCWHLLRVSWPIGAQGALEMSAWTLFTAGIARLGAVDAAAHAIAIRVTSLAYMAGYGLCVAATTLVGQYLGAQDQAAARRSMRSCLGLVVGLMGSLGLGFVLWSTSLVRLFTHDEAVVSLGVSVMLCVGLLQVFDGITLVGTGVLRGAGNTRWPMLVGLACNWGLFIPGAALAIFVWPGGMLGGWMAALTTVVLIGLMTLGRVLRRDW
ncbi:MAG: MATE family efflux transporter [Candidatus Tectomicrobia bacterium]|uniref:Multidrug-efflux transporter n=1 Tax=Tectimicrobiota bacterium TaxID=2528274 RepID=A0A937W2V7_UNCTE|nr:MATE family efflux transporter [Candidatus Tectomicrobia bacterium]